jgi:hypothetical protein
MRSNELANFVIEKYFEARLTDEIPILVLDEEDLMRLHDLASCSVGAEEIRAAREVAYARIGDLVLSRADREDLARPLDPEIVDAMAKAHNPEPEDRK